jgi:hypothetical protein
MLVANEFVARPVVGFYCVGKHVDEAEHSALRAWSIACSRRQVSMSVFMQIKDSIDEARNRLGQTARLIHGWDTYGGDPPNEMARTIAANVLTLLEAEALPPARLLPSAEGGIAISFVEGARRAEIETYNTGEIIAAIYSADDEPLVWELDDSAGAITSSIEQIRVHLAA